MKDSEKTLAFPVGALAISSERTGDAHANAALSSLLRGIAALPHVLDLLQAQGKQIDALKSEIKALRVSQQGTAANAGWLDSEKAREYLSMSANTFDKYRYQTSPRIKGYKVGGKTLFKREDLDNFVRLYEIKSIGHS